MKKTIEEKKKDILTVATKLFAENGYEAATMAEIAKLANVGFGTVATYYQNKETLLLKCVEEPMNDFLHEVLQFNVKPDDYQKEIQALTLRHFYLFYERRIYLLLIIQVRSQYEKYKKPFLVVDSASKEIIKKLEKLIQNGQAESKLAAGEPNIIANAYISILLGLFLWNTDHFSNTALKLFAENSMRIFGLR